MHVSVFNPPKVWSYWYSEHKRAAESIIVPYITHFLYFEGYNKVECFWKHLPAPRVCSSQPMHGTDSTYSGPAMQQKPPLKRVKTICLVGFIPLFMMWQNYEL